MTIFELESNQGKLVDDALPLSSLKERDTNGQSLKHALVSHCRAHYVIFCARIHQRFDVHTLIIIFVLHARNAEELFHLVCRQGALSLLGRR